MERIGDFRLVWGESLRWDDRRRRLYFVDCANHCLHWLDDGDTALNELRLPSLPTGVVLTNADDVIVCLDDGLHLVNADARTAELLTPYPDGFHGRANDANADIAGNLITGTLNLAPGPGALWWFSHARGWQPLDDTFGNVNGPAVLDAWQVPTLVVADTLAGCVVAYPYDAQSGRVGARRVLADAEALGGYPDGTTIDTAGGLWICVLGAGKLVRLTEGGIERTVDVPAINPSDVAFGGNDRKRLFMTSIAVDPSAGAEAGSLIAFDDLGVAGEPERRFAIT